MKNFKYILPSLSFQIKITHCTIYLLLNLPGGRREKVELRFILHKEDTTFYHLFQLVKAFVSFAPVETIVFFTAADVGFRCSSGREKNRNTWPDREARRWKHKPSFLWFWGRIIKENLDLIVFLIWCNCSARVYKKYSKA